MKRPFQIPPVIALLAGAVSSQVLPDDRERQLETLPAEARPSYDIDSARAIPLDTLLPTGNGRFAPGLALSASF